jgi:hypothetical protein
MTPGMLTANWFVEKSETSEKRSKLATLAAC